MNDVHLPTSWRPAGIKRKSRTRIYVAFAVGDANINDVVRLLNGRGFLGGSILSSEHGEHAFTRCREIASAAVVNHCNYDLVT